MSQCEKSSMTIKDTACLENGIQGYAPSDPKITIKVDWGEHSMEVLAVKSNLMVCSEYFRRLIRSNPGGPLTIKNVQPEVFEILLRFIEKMRFENEISCVKTLCMLADAAEKLQVDCLGEACEKELEAKINLGNVWDTYSDYSDFKYVASACEKLLSKQTEKLLENPEFLEIKPESLSRFLALKEMEIFSEESLVKASVAYAKTQKHGGENEVFRKYALPHLRLLTLPLPQLLRVEEYLTIEEKLFLVESVYSGMPVDIPAAKISLNLAKKERRSERICTLAVVPREKILALDQVFREGMIFPIAQGEEHTFILRFKAKKSLEIKQIELFCPLNLRSVDFFSERPIHDLERKAKDLVRFAGSLMKIKVSVQNGIETSREFKPLAGEYFMDHWMAYRVSAVAQKSALVTVEATVKDRWFLRHFDVKKGNHAYENEVLHLKAVEHWCKNGNGRFRSVDKIQATTIFKSVSFSSA